MPPAVSPPSEPTAESEGITDTITAVSCDSDGQPIFIAIATLLLGLCLGFLIGARSRQLTANIKVLGQAVLSLPSLLKVKAADAGAGLETAEAMKDGEDEREDEDPRDAEAEENFEDFLQTGEIPGLEDHVDLEINPVIMYNIKKAKEAQQLQVRREALAVEGLTEDEIEAKLMSNASGGVSDAKPNALAVLISVGARVEPVKGGQNEDAMKRNEMRRTQRNINAFLSKTLEIDTSLKPMKEGKGRLKNALDVAKDTKHKPYGDSVIHRETMAARHAKSARKIYRSNNHQITKQLEATMPSTGRHAGFSTIDADDIAALIAEEAAAEPGLATEDALEPDLGGEDGEEMEGEEGEGEEDGDEELGA